MPSFCGTFNIKHAWTVNPSPDDKLHVTWLTQSRSAPLLTFTLCPLLVTELKDTGVAASSSSLNSENPYATIKDLPGLPFSPPESSYMEMRTTVPDERSYTEISPPPFSTATLPRGGLLYCCSRPFQFMSVVYTEYLAMLACKTTKQTILYHYVKCLGFT